MFFLFRVSLAGAFAIDLKIRILHNFPFVLALLSLAWVIRGLKFQRTLRFKDSTNQQNL